MTAEWIFEERNRRNDLRSSRTGPENHERSQDFSKGESHCVKQRVLAFSQPDYCRLF